MKAIVIHSGGMDSSITLALAIKKYGHSEVLSLTFDYGQRNRQEIYQAKKIAEAWGVRNTCIPVDVLNHITKSALLDSQLEIEKEDKRPNTWVVGRNGLWARLGAIYAHQLNVSEVHMGLIAVEGSFSGYPDCSRQYIDLIEQILRIDLDSPHFSIVTPIIDLTKAETLKIAEDLNVLDYLLEETVSCYNGLKGSGCGKCPSCALRHKGYEEFLLEKKRS